MRAKRPCLHPRCPVLTDQGRCPDHQRPRTSANDRGYTGRWHQYSKRYRLEHPLCHYCAYRGRFTATECVDHATPPSRGGDFWDDQNHRPACIACNSAKGNRTEAEFLSTLGS